MGLWRKLLGKVSVRGAERAGRAARVISLLSPEMASTGGLPHRAIAGTLRGASSDPAAFEANPAFIELVHEVVRDFAPQDPGAQAEARLMGSGWLYIVDQRQSPGIPHVPPEDIVGYFRVEGGCIQQASYTPNPGHVVFTERGLVHLPGTLHEALIASAAQEGQAEKGPR